jgi:hypothetical protein
MRSVESGDKYVGKFSLATRRALQMPSISLARKNKLAFFQQLLKTLNQWRKRRQPEFFEFPTGSFQAIQCAQQ